MDREQINAWCAEAQRTTSGFVEQVEFVMRRAEAEAIREASRIATALHAKHFPHVAAWQLESDLVGVLLQIDNMTSALANPATLAASKVTEEEVGRAALSTMIDAAMGEAGNLHPPLGRSDCERIIRAAVKAAKGDD